MCGFTGLWQSCTPLSEEYLRQSVTRMTRTLSRRGPDDAGIWTDWTNGLALGHRRLAVLDLSSAGKQPMVSASGRFVIAFNGEIYNHLALRAELDAVSLQSRPSQGGEIARWAGHSDTETLLAAFEQWGVEATLKKTVGMFAIALWDAQERVLSLARDRVGEKPLYYGWVGEGEQRALVFGSELKALRARTGFNAPVCRQALTQYLRFNYIPAPRTIYQGVFKLEPGCLLTIQSKPPASAPTNPVRPGHAYGSLHVHRWWSLAEVVQRGARNLLNDEADAIGQLETQLSEAISLQSLADVPLGAFLSGGVDSSTIAALMQRQSARPIKTFTIGFGESGFDESPHALAVARHLETDHHEIRVTSQMAQDVIPSLPQMYDEPFADSSQIPTHLVCRAARQHVTVALSGDAGDELFGGYNRYVWGPRIWSRVGGLPGFVRKALGSAISGVPVSAWDIVGTPLMGSENRMNGFGEKLHKLAGGLQNADSINDFYRSLVSEWRDPAAMVLSAKGGRVEEPVSLLDDPLPHSGLEDAALSMMYQDAMTYLSDDILCKVDRAAMSVSLETRVPFLDHRVVELAWRLPLHMKVRGNAGKWALRQILYKYVPREMIERPKAGFAVPIGQWLRGPLRDWAEDLLSEARLRKEGYLDPRPVRDIWQQHLTCRRDWTARLWSVLMFQSWLAENS